MGSVIKVLAAIACSALVLYCFGIFDKKQPVSNPGEGWIQMDEKPVIGWVPVSKNDTSEYEASDSIQIITAENTKRYAHFSDNTFLGRYLLLYHGSYPTTKNHVVKVKYVEKDHKLYIGSAWVGKYEL